MHYIIRTCILFMCMLAAYAWSFGMGHTPHTPGWSIYIPIYNTSEHYIRRDSSAPPAIDACHTAIDRASCLNMSASNNCAWCPEQGNSGGISPESGVCVQWNPCTFTYTYVDGDISCPNPVYGIANSTCPFSQNMYYMNLLFATFLYILFWILISIVFLCYYRTMAVSYARKLVIIVILVSFVYAVVIMVSFVGYVNDEFWGYNLAETVFITMIILNLAFLTIGAFMLGYSIINDCVQTMRNKEGLQGGTARVGVTSTPGTASVGVTSTPGTASVGVTSTPGIIYGRICLFLSTCGRKICCADYEPVTVTIEAPLYIGDEAL